MACTFSEGLHPPCLPRGSDAAVAQAMSALGWERSSGWSHPALQGQDSRAAPPQVRFEPMLTNAAAATDVRFDFTKTVEQTTIGNPSTPY